MQVNVVPAKQGTRWVLDGISYIRAQPMAMLAVTFLYLLCLILPSLIPGLGYAAPLIITPVLSVGLVHCARAVDRKQTVVPSMLLSGLKDSGGNAWKSLLLMGIVNAVFTVLALGFASLIDGGTLWKLVTGVLKPDDPALKQQATLVLGFGSFLFVYIPLQMTMWYAPIFIAWHKMGIGQAMFSSFFAVWQNKGAFLRYGFTWFGLMICVSFAINTVAMITKSAVLVSFLTFPISTIAVAAVYASFWPSYRDAIQLTADDAPAAPVTDQSST
jgi:hypothetical protein